MRVVLLVCVAPPCPCDSLLRVRRGGDVRDRKYVDGRKRVLARDSGGVVTNTRGGGVDVGDALIASGLIVLGAVRRSISKGVRVVEKQQIGKNLNTLRSDIGTNLNDLRNGLMWGLFAVAASVAIASVVAIVLLNGATPI